MRVHPFYVSMLADPSDWEDCLPHEAPRGPVADLTKLPTRLPFRTSTFSKTTHSVLPQHGHRGPSANSGDLTHSSTIEGGLAYRSPLQSIANIPLYPVNTSCESNQLPLKPFKNPPSQKLSSRDSRLPLLRPIATNSQPTKQTCLKPPRLTPRLPPLTDPTETETLWAIVRKKMANTRVNFSAGKQKAGKGTFSYRDNELESRKITITASSRQPVYQWLPSIDPASGQELGGLYLEVSPDFASEIQDWALCFSTFDPPMSEYQWATDVFVKFLPVQMYPPRSKKDLIKLRRQQQPYVP